MSKKGKKSKPYNDKKRKPFASPVCYMCEFPEYFEGRESGEANADDTPKKNSLRF